MSKTIEITELDFSNIKASIINYMKKDSTFKDYDFEASGLNTLIDLLATNTHINSYYLNMLTNEMFLDTARIRENVVSKAKLLNYTPRSYRSSQAVVSLELVGNRKYSNANVYDTVRINRGVVFSAQLDGAEYLFVPKSTRLVEKTTAIQNSDGTWSNVYRIDDLVIIQGTEVEEEYVVDTSNPEQRFILSNKNVDTTTLRVFVQPDPQDDLVLEYKPSRDNMRLESTSEVFFLQEGKNEKYEVFFGDGILGSEVDSGEVVILRYIVTKGSIANGIAQFSIKENNERDNYKITSINVESPSYGGAEKESISSIKFNAPRNFENQKRAVTIRDYKSLIPQILPTTSSVNVWGGEDNIPAQFGKVFIAIRPNNGYFLSDYEKENIKSILRKDYSVVSILPDIVDPDYTRIKIKTIVKWDNESTVLTADELKAKVLNTIQNYSDQYLNEFDSYFRYSNFVYKIDETDQAISNNVTYITMINERRVIFQSKAPYQFNFNNEIKKGTLKSVGFQVEGANNYWYLEEDTSYNGNLKFYSFDNTGKKIYAPYITGRVNYLNGIVNINDIVVTNIETGLSDWLRLEAEPVSFDIFPRRNQILFIDKNDVTVTMDADTDDYNNNYDISSQNVTIIRQR